MDNESEAPRYVGYAVLNSEDREHRGLHGESLIYPQQDIAVMKMEESGGFKVVKVEVFDDKTARITDVAFRDSQ